MLVKMKATGPGLKPSPTHQENVETPNMDTEVDREAPGRITDSSIKRED